MNKGFTPLQRAVANFDVNYLHNHIHTRRPDLVVEWDFLRDIEKKAVEQKRLISEFLPYEEYSERQSEICRSILKSGMTF